MVHSSLFLSLTRRLDAVMLFPKITLAPMPQLWAVLDMLTSSEADSEVSSYS